MTNAINNAVAHLQMNQRTITPECFVSYLMQQEWGRIGSGCFAKVFAHKDAPDTVIKVGRVGHRDGWWAFHRWMEQNQWAKECIHLPIVRGSMKITADLCIADNETEKGAFGYVAFIEKLIDRDNDVIRYSDQYSNYCRKVENSSREMRSVLRGAGSKREISKITETIKSGIFEDALVLGVVHEMGLRLSPDWCEDLHHNNIMFRQQGDNLVPVINDPYSFRKLKDD